MNSDSDTEEPSPEALVRYLAMRRHTVGVGDSRLEAPCDLRIKLAHHQAATAALMRPMLISPSNLLQQSNLPQVLTPPSGDDVTSAGGDSGFVQTFSSSSGSSTSGQDSHLLQPPQLYSAGEPWETPQ